MRRLLSLVLLLLSGSAAWAQQVTVFSDDFEAVSGLNATDWPTVSGNFDNGGGTGFRSGTYNGAPNGFGGQFPSYTLYFRSNSARDAQTRIINTSGGDAVLTFDLRYTAGNLAGTSTSSTPFDELDSALEEILVEYTTDGTNYTTLQQFSFLTTYSFGTVTINLPLAAWTTTTRIRWRQVGFTVDPTVGALRWDHWAIDNVQVVANPEPGTWALFGLGAAGLAAFAARRRRARAARRSAG